MYNILARANLLLANFCTTLFALAFCIFLSTVLIEPTLPVDLKTGRVDVKMAKDYTKQSDLTNDLGFVTFSAKTNLENLFNWNVKQIFLWVVAEYKTMKNEYNQVVIWDKIIKKEDIKSFQIVNAAPKYSFYDDGVGGLIGNPNVTLRFGYNVVRNIGRLTNHYCDYTTTFKFPKEYAKK